MEALIFILLIISSHLLLAISDQQIRKVVTLHFYSQITFNRFSCKASNIPLSGFAFSGSADPHISSGEQVIFSPTDAAVVAERNDFYIFRIWQGRKKKNLHLLLTFGNPDLINST